MCNQRHDAYLVDTPHTLPIARPPGRTWAVLVKRGGVRKELGVAVPPEIGGLWGLDAEDFSHAEWARLGR